MTAVGHGSRYHQVLAARFRKVLANAMEHRRERQKVVEDPDGYPEIEFAAYERRCMHEAVSEERAAHGLPAVSLEAVFAVEKQAMGHSDYARKFAFYCAGLATGPVRPAGGAR